MTRHSIAIEVIEDSEPEREESRRQLKQKHTTKRPFQTHAAKINAAKPISSGETRRTGDLATFDSDSVIDITDSEESPILGPSRMLPKCTESTSILAQTTTQILPTATHVVTSESSSESDGDTQLKLNRFAFRKPPRQLGRSTSTTSSTGQVEKPAVESERPVKPTRRAIKSHRFADDFSDADLAKLSKCVCCDLAWTTRKGVAQKMAHIQSCAKKHALKDETIKILIRRAVENAPAPTKSKGKAKAADPENDSPEAPGTFMEHIVGGIEPKKKGRRVGATVTVRAAEENEEANRARVRAILGKCDKPRIQEAIGRPDSEVFGPSKLAVQLGRKLGELDEPPCTQAFGQSALGQRQQSTNGRSVLDSPIRQETPVYSESSDDDMSTVPTQPFTASRLASLHRPSFETNPVTISPQRSSSSISPSKTLGSPCSSVEFVSSGSRDHFRPLPQATNNESVNYLEAQHYVHDTERSEADQGLEGQLDDGLAWNGDGAILHYDPDIEDRVGQPQYISNKQITPEGSDTGQQCTYTTPNKTTKVCKTMSRLSSPDHLDTAMTNKGNKKSTKSRGKRRAINEDDALPLDEDWEEVARAKIMEDEELHLRILRYEPVHFDIFLRKVSDSEKPSGRLKFALRAFLDKQAIHFVGQDSGRR